ncbi:MAG: flagellar export protein FliJ [Clostridia bacterium]|nr:flagellar export protein FliJ [Clostridia bacterium]
MAKFFYRMQNILDVKSKLEEQAKLDFAIANRLLNEEEEKLAALKKRKADYEEAYARLLSETLKLREIREVEAAIELMKEKIQEQELQVRVAMRKVEAAREYMQLMMQERKTHEKLKEKAFEAFMLEENAKEGKEIDELTSYRYGTKRNE